MDSIIFYGFPVYALFLGIELLISSSHPENRYRLNNAMSNSSSGLLDQVVNAFSATAFAGVFHVIQEQYGLVNFSWNPWLVGFLLLIGIDFCYYWFHRAAHRINVLWAAHIGHHQSESYDLTVSLRHSVFAGWINKAFYLPLAFLGFPALLFVLVHALFQLYQFFVHTHLINSFGKLDAVFASPKLHQVHHARNARYLDKNYGGLFITWDKLFGTFQTTIQKEKTLYGITTGIRQWHPLWANFHYLKFLYRISKQMPTWKLKCLVWIKPPDWDQIAEFQGDLITHEYGYNDVLSRPVQVYVAVQFLLNIYFLYVLLSFRPGLELSHFWIIGGFLMLNFIGLPALFDRIKFFLRLEKFRHVIGIAVAIFCLVQFDQLTWFHSILLAAEVLGGVWYVLMNTEEFGKIKDQR